MIRRRRRGEDAGHESRGHEHDRPTGPPQPEAGTGPWDARDVPADLPGYVDLGALRVRGRIGFQLQVPQDDGGGNGAVVLVGEDAGLELRAFAAARSGGLWDEVRAELRTEVERLEGTAEEVDGPHGPELRISVPVAMPDGSPGVQPSRIVGVEGARWFLRATFLGRAALEPDEEGLFERALREVVVVRGDDPRPVREALLIEVPETATSQQTDAAGEPTDPA